MRTTLLAVAMALVVSILPLSAQAVTDHYRLNIPRQSLDAALKDLANQTGVQIARFSDMPHGGVPVVGPLSGDMSVREALTAILNKTGFTYRVVNDRTIAIVAPGAASAAAPASSTSQRPAASGEAGAASDQTTLWSRFLVAQADQLGASSTVDSQEGQQRSSQGPGSRSQEPSTGLEEIVVTAQRRAEPLQDVPVSVAAYGQADIQRLGISGIEDVTRLTPGVGITYSAGYSPLVSIRGIASTPGASTTGIYIDDTPTQVRMIGAGYQSVTAFPTVFDLERIEVLRGPQGTLFGAGSEGGAVRFITPEPSLTDYSGHARAEFGFNEVGAPSYQLGTAVGGPIVSDSLGFRVSAYVQEDGGWIDHRPYPSPYVAEKNVNWVRTATLNASLAWAVTDNLVVTPRVFYQSLTSGGPPVYWRGLSNPSSDDFVVGYQPARPILDQFSLPSLKVEWHTGSVELVSNTSNLNRTRTLTEDFTFYINEVATGNFNAGPFTYAPSPSSNPQHEFTQEIRLQSSDPNSRLRWLFGVFYQTLDERADQEILAPTANSVFGVPVLPGGLAYTGFDSSRDTQKAVFGQVDIGLVGNELTATLGSRYAKLNFSYTNAQDGPFNGGAPSGSSGGSSASASTPKFGLDYKPRAGLLFYADAAKGFRPGGGNPPVPSGCAANLNAYGFASAPPSYDPDHVWSYELGSKGDAFEHRFAWDASAYWINWTKIQNDLPLPLCGFVFTANLGAAISKGFDLDTKYALGERFTIEASVGYDKAYFTQTLPVPGTPNNTVTEGELLATPPWHGFLGAEYQFAPTPSNIRMYIHVDDSYTSHFRVGNPQDANYDPRAPGDYGAVNILSARFGIRRASWDVSFFSKNLLNTHPLLFVVFHDLPTSDLFADQTVPPRVVGITGTYRF